MTALWLWELLRPLAMTARGLIKPEDQFAAAVATMLRARAMDGTLRCIFTHVSGESAAGAGGKAAGAKFRVALRYIEASARGAISGCADLLFLSSFGSLAIELKAGRNKQSPKQVLFERWCQQVGVPYHVVTASTPETMRDAVKEVERILIEAGMIVL